MKKSHYILGGILFLMLSQSAHTQDLRLVFPQVAVGDQWGTIIDLWSKGSEDFVGDLHIYDDDGIYLPVAINGAPVQDKYPLSIPKGSMLRLMITAVGETKAGHALIFNRTESDNPNFDQHISGSLAFQFKDGTTLQDSVGVTPADTVEHFHFVGEYTSNVVTGLALSEPSGEGVTITIKAYSSTGQLVDQISVELNPNQHRAFFINQELNLTLGFMGTIEVESTGSIAAVVLRAEGSQYSTIDVGPFWALFDIEISLEGGKSYKAEAVLFVSNRSAKGWIRFTDPVPDEDLKVMTLMGICDEGELIASTLVAFEGEYIAVVLASDTFRTFSSSIAGEVFWNPLSAASTEGSFQGTRRN
jgi:hypothetical protein